MAAGCLPAAGLTDILLEDKAVVTPCMHGFCYRCIWRWLTTHKRVCPLCKAKADSGGPCGRQPRGPAGCAALHMACAWRELRQ